MRFRSNHERSAVVILIIAAAALTILPLTEDLRPFRPHWLTLALFYMGVFAPLQSGIIRSWLLGVMVDVITGSLLGIHALTFAFTTFIALQFHLQLRVFAGAQQMVIVAIVTAINLVAEYLIYNATGRTPETLLFWGPILTTPLFWPPLYVLADRLIRR